MPLVFGAIAPHGGDAIAEIADDPRVMATTRAGMEELARRCAAARPETFVVLNPHGMMLEGSVSLGAAPRATGSLGGPFPRPEIFLDLETDLPFAESILREAEVRSLPVVPVAAQASEKGERLVPLDWGALVPLYFLTRALPPSPPPPRVVVLAPDRGLPRETLVRIGLAIARAAAATETRVALIASCDQGHGHSADGPYGFAPESAQQDQMMCEVITRNDLPSLLDPFVWSEEFLDDAKVDAYWQTIMLAGALGHTPMRGELLSYEAPTYFGMAVAAYTPQERMQP